MAYLAKVFFVSLLHAVIEKSQPLIRAHLFIRNIRSTGERAVLRSKREKAEHARRSCYILITVDHFWHVGLH